MHPHNQNIFIVRAVENTDLPLLWERLVDTPQVIMPTFRTIGSLKRSHHSGQWIERFHHVTNRSIFAPGINALQNN